MKRCVRTLVMLGGLLAAVTAAGAQAPGPGGSPIQGFSSQALISELSLYLPPESTQGMYSAFGGRGGGAAGQTGQAGQGAQTGQAQGAGSQAGGRGFQQMQFTRDPKLFLTKDQITKLLPLLLSLRDNPMPTPSKAKQVQADVDAILTVAQKAEYAEFQKQMQKLIQQFRQQMSANGGSGGFAASGQAGQGSQGQGSAQAGQQGSGQSGGASQLTPLQRRQRQLDAFIKVLQDRLKQISA
ncbi:MAG: hypothetical protein ABSF77_16310 [Spirochaetia bacterium]